ncbi:hypothetical protein ADIARSV_2658 [Arcticibacter svalbardensis MN12-7]|uniref:Uncharacterized protein n=1 Tax=Arcticibacter svalbardensis MN12-7 TaxID=1150600 RepID=R9GR60_9SPHI|nr:polysaccharide lyase family 8 super-sandwich domain-containing protein [Arcticibacter svalbardensis]EOR94163.1 hypothetical protein ADIARSV_2658 [Arcticibacter svalbardensis MN12-7]
MSDGNFGVTTMDFNKATQVNGLPVVIAARKANFLFNKEMICLGAGITSSYSLAPTTTTLNQSYLKGSVLVNGATVPPRDNTYNDVRWIYHEGTGYVFRSNTTAKMKTNFQSGNWYTIKQAQTNETVTADVFKLWLDHGNAPSNATYKYAVLPNFTSSETSIYATNMPVETVSNTSSLQAVSHKTLKQTGAILYLAGTVDINETLKVAVDKPCILLINWGANPIKVTASDPNQTETTLNVIISYSGLKSEILTFPLPYSNAIGTSMTKTAATTRLVDERFDNTTNMTAVAGGVWSLVGGELALSNPTSNAFSTPANINVNNTPNTGDFIRTLRAKVMGTSSNLDVLCLVWNQQNPANSYYYVNINESNTAGKSGIFKVVNGFKSAQLANVTVTLIPDVWNNLELQKIGDVNKIFLNGELVSQLTDNTLTSGFVGLGFYDNTCSFNNLSVLKYNNNLMDTTNLPYDPTVNILKFQSVDRDSDGVIIYPNPSSGKFNVKLNDSLTGANIKVFF